MLVALKLSFEVNLSLLVNELLNFFILILVILTSSNVYLGGDFDNHCPRLLKDVCFGQCWID